MAAGVKESRMTRADELEKRFEEQVDKMIHQLLEDAARDGTGDAEERRRVLTRALIHRAVHFAAAGPGVEFCALATYLAEMVGHAHKLQHGEQPASPKHRDSLH
jgi:hypothetical protein